jgi:prolyl 4-hydroxylase
MDEPWALEVYGHDGKATNVTMEIGDMVLYESHSVIHGRPFPLKGDLFVNVFVHFEPTDTSSYDPKIGLPPYIIPGSAWAKAWKQDYPGGWLWAREQGYSADYYEEEEEDEEDEEDEENENEEEEEKGEDGDEGDHDADGVLVAAKAIWQGDVEWLREIAEQDPATLDQLDENGWHALHEAVRFGNIEMIQILLDHGADVNQETYYKQTPLSLALKYHGSDHPVTEFLLEQGAEDPDL